jgi:O-antigen ligase
LGLLAVAGLGCGLGPAFYGYFDMSVWGPLALGTIVVALALLVARPAIPTGAALAAVLGLLLYGAWALLSTGWGESADRALVEGDRWIFYGVFLLVLVLLVADFRDRVVFLVAAMAGILGIAAYDLLTMLAGDGPDLFSATRLLEPLGYINGLGGFFLLGFWPLVAVGERVRNHALAGLAASGATLLAALVLLTESRGTAFAFAASALVVLALFPGRGRRAWLLITVLAGLFLFAYGPLADVTEPLRAAQATPPAATIESGAEASFLAALLVGVVWALGRWAASAAADSSEELERQLPRVSAALLGALAVLAVVVGLVAVEDPAGRVADQYDSFTSLGKVESGNRFTAGGGNRYDYWRIAWGQFTDEPLKGVGAGNFDRTYFLERRTGEDVRQAHSIELQALGETGLVGALLLGAFIVAVLLGAWRRAAAARASGAELGFGVAATGVFMVWLAQTSVDWLHLIPGVTGVALGAAAILLSRPDEGVAQPRRLRAFPPVGLALVAALAVLAIVFVGRPTLATKLRSDAQAELATEPVSALESVNESLSLNPDSLQSYYTKAAALARLGLYRPARAALVEAIDREPHNYVSWALLGDIETRRGNVDAALRAYRRASVLNPRDRELRLLATDPALVERLSRNPDDPAAALEAALFS